MIVKTHTEGEPLPDLPQANQIHHQVHKESLYSSMHPSTSSSSFKVIRNNGHHQQKVTSESLPSLDSRDDFRKGSRVLPSSLLQIIFAVLQTNAEEIKRLLHEVSDPFSPSYGNHLSRTSIAKWTSNPASTAAIKSFLKEQGATIVSETVYGEYIVAEGTVQLWERLVSAEFYHYESVIEERGYDPKVKTFIRSMQYTIPEVLQNHVFAIHNTVQIPLRKKRPFVAKGDTDSTINSTLDKQPRINGTISSTLPYTSINTLNRIYSIGSNRGHPLATQGDLLSMYIQSFDTRRMIERIPSTLTHHMQVSTKRSTSHILPPTYANSNASSTSRNKESPVTSDITNIIKIVRLVCAAKRIWMCSTLWRWRRTLQRRTTTPMSRSASGWCPWLI